MVLVIEKQAIPYSAPAPSLHPVKLSAGVAAPVLRPGNAKPGDHAAAPAQPQNPTAEEPFQWQKVLVKSILLKDDRVERLAPELSNLDVMG